MKYMGSKRRIAKEILPIILKDRKDGQWYVEPFVGGANVIDKVDGNRIGADSNKYLIALLKHMQTPDFELPFVGEEMYQKIKNNKDKFPDWLVGYAGFQLSFGAKFFGGYRRDKAGVRDYENEAQQNLKAQQNGIKTVSFLCCSYQNIMLPHNCIVYCDPPYANAVKYGNDCFDSALFWSWATALSSSHTVFVSEYSAPIGWNVVWQKTMNVNLDVSTTAVRTEKLFVWGGSK